MYVLYCTHTGIGLTRKIFGCGGGGGGGDGVLRVYCIYRLIISSAFRPASVAVHNITLSLGLGAR